MYIPTAHDIGPELTHRGAEPSPRYFCETCIERLDLRPALWHISQGHHVVNRLGVRQLLTERVRRDRS